MARFHPFRDRDRAQSKFGLSHPRRLGQILAIWIVLAGALWSGVHFGLAVPAAYPFAIADWGGNGDYATTAPQLQGLDKDIARDIASAARPLYPAQSEVPELPRPTPRSGNTGTPLPSVHPDRQTLTLTSDRRTAARGSIITYNVLFTTSDEVRDVSIVIVYPQRLLAESALCAAPERDLNGCVTQDADGHVRRRFTIIGIGSSRAFSFQLFVRSDAVAGAEAVVIATADWQGADSNLTSSATVRIE